MSIVRFFEVAILPYIVMERKLITLGHQKNLGSYGYLEIPTEAALVKMEHGHIVLFTKI